MPTHAWYNLKRTKVLETLKTRRAGLTEREVKRRQRDLGLNELPTGQRLSGLVIFVRQFHSSLIYILLAAAAISLWLRDYVDTYVIIAAVILNVVVGFIQEFRALKAMARLRQAVRFQTIVRRQGEERQIDIAQLVPGDVVLIQAGNNIPADLRFIEASDLQINESRLTGESVPVAKTHLVQSGELVLADRKNMAFMGTLVTRGSGVGIVCETGSRTELGRIAKLIADTKEERTPLQRHLSELSRVISLIVLALSVVILCLGLLAGRDFTVMFSTSVAIAVAAVPEGLAVGVTVILAVGMQRILKHHALVRRLLAAETLGSITVICTDKTGTLTEGEMRVVRVITNNHDLEAGSDRFHTHLQEIGDRASFITTLKVGVMCNDARIENETKPLAEWVVIGTPTEKALLLAGSQVGLSRTPLEKAFPRLSVLPFSSETKYMMTLHEDKANGNVVYLKGAPEVVLAKTGRIDIDGNIETFSNTAKRRLQKRYEHLSEEGLRILALGYRPAKGQETLEEADREKTDFVFLGFIGIKDPLRPEAKQTLAACAQAGIQAVMITGDHRLTAQAIARELGLPSRAENIIEGVELQKLNHSQLQKRVQKISVYARVTPEDKLRIVDAWQARGEVVAMTGDGVNDAPALRKANIGVALGSGTDVAKETASLVMLDNNFATIVAAVRQGRVIFDNIRKMILYLMSDSLSAVIIVAGSLALGLPLPLLPVQILWINLITDGFPNVALTQEPEESDSLRRPPLHPKSPIINLEMRTLILVISAVTGLITLALFAYYYQTTGDTDLARTIAFASLGLNSLLYVFSCRSLRRSVLQTNPFSNPLLLVAVVLGLLFQVGGIYIPALAGVLGTVPLAGEYWWVIGAVAFVVIGLIELIKFIFLKTGFNEKN